MGSVYLASHTLIGSKAAIKVLKPEFSHRPELVERFFNEAKAASAIRHPGIVDIYDFGYYGQNVAYIVMEHLSGESLADRLKRMGRLPVNHALYLLRQVTSGLAAAHDQRIVHRDLKPDNIFVVPDPDMPAGERTKILDFGIAKLAVHSAGFKTSTGTVMGTPSYMAPEQCKGAGRVDSRADIYALGCILFEMLCGRPPFVAEGGGEIMAQHIYEAPRSPRSLDPSLSPAVDAMCLRLIAKNPDDRYQSARDLLGEIDALLSSGAPALGTDAGLAAGTAPAPPRPPAETTLGGAARSLPPTNVARRRGFLAPLLVAAALAVAGVIFAVARGGGEEVATTAPVDDRPASGVGSDATVAGAAGDSGVARATVPFDATRAASEPPKTVTLELRSSPKGAEVYRMPAMVRVGMTPYTVTAPPVDGELVFVVRKRGYASATVAVRADVNVEQEVVLTRHRRADKPDKPDKPPASGTKPPPTDVKPPVSDDRSLDPFNKKKPKGRALDPFSK